MTPTIGHFQTLVLKTLSSAPTPTNGSQLGKTLREAKMIPKDFQDANLYKALHRLRDRGLVAAVTKARDKTRTVTYYQVTDAGKACIG